MRTATAVALLIIGIIMAAAAYYAAYLVSVGLGYALALASVGLGVYVIVKRGSMLHLALGAILVLVGAGSVASIAFVHAAVMAVKEGVKKAVEVEKAEGVIGETLEADGWRLTVLWVRDAEFIVSDSSVYLPHNGSRVVVVHVKLQNIGNESLHPTAVEAVLVTSSGKSYRSVHPVELKWSLRKPPTEGLRVKPITLTVTVAPGTSIEGDLLFEVPVNEKPAELRLKLGVIGGVEFLVKLNRA